MLVSHPGILILAMQVGGRTLPLFHYAFVLNKTRNVYVFQVGKQCPIGVPPLY